MEKAYDIKELGRMIEDKIKAQGGPALGEDIAELIGKSAYLAFKDWAKASAVLSSTRVDDFIAPFYDQLDPFVIPLIEKIDLDKDGK